MSTLKPMAKKKDHVEAIDSDDLDIVEQNEALLHYKVTGEVGKFVDPLRDQEPDIAPERGVAPHPELFNPAPPKGSPFLGEAIDKSKNDVVLSFDEKNKRAEDEADRVQAVADAINESNEEAAKEDEDFDKPADLSKEDALNLHLTSDESPKSSQAVGPHLS